MITPTAGLLDSSLPAEAFSSATVAAAGASPSAADLCVVTLVSAGLATSDVSCVVTAVALAASEVATLSVLTTLLALSLVAVVLAASLVTATTAVSDVWSTT